MHSRLTLIILTSCLYLTTVGWCGAAFAGSKPDPGTRSSTSTVSQSQQVKYGRTLFKTYDCSACHIAAGKGCAVGISLDGIKTRRSRQFIVDQLLDPEGHVAKHAKEFGNNPDLMPNPRFSKEQAEAVASYLASLPTSTRHGKDKKRAR